MDEDRTELILRLCAAAGMIMEDASAMAVLLVRQERETLSEQVQEVRRRAQEALILIEAAVALNGTH